MKLKDYLDSNGIKYHAFAEKIEISPKSLWSILYKGTDMRLSTAMKIENATRGEVTCQELAKEIENKSKESKE